MFARIYELGLFTYIHPALTWSNVHAAQLQQLLKLSVEPGWDLPGLRIHDVPAGQPGQVDDGLREIGRNDAACTATHRRERPALREQ